MSILPGIYASQISGHLFTAGTYDSIATVTIGSAQSTISFSSIPSTYKHLQVRFASINASSQSIIMQLNSDTASNYAKHALIGTGASANAYGFATQSYINIQGYAAAGATPNPVVGVVDILDYGNTNKYKTARAIAGFDANGSGEIGLMSGLWQSTSAVSTITFKLESGGNFNQYSSFALYGIKGA